MASDAKTEGLACVDGVDRISNLPTDLKFLILERLPLHDAARTSILSKIWASIWGMHPRLEFDDTFFSQLVSRNVSKKDKQTQLSEVSRTISNILLSHSGPILKFILYIPQNLPLHRFLDMTAWIKYISNNGVRKLKIFNLALSAYKIPTHLFSCLELTHLRLTNCILKPPHNFRGFRNLIDVELVDVIITSDMSFGTQLDGLELTRCTGIEHLKRQFECDNNLNRLFFVDCGEIDWQWFEYPKKVEIFCLRLKGTLKNIMNLDKLVDSMPKIEALHLNGIFLKFLEPGAAVRKKLTTTMENLEYLNLYDVGFYDLVQIQYVLLLIRSSPYLEVLDIDLEHKVQSNDGMDLLDGMIMSEHMILDRLEALILHEMVGSRAEFWFIKLLLASSPSLRRIELKMNKIVDDPAEKLRISQEVLQIPRTSKYAQIEWK